MDKLLLAEFVASLRFTIMFKHTVNGDCMVFQ